MEGAEGKLHVADIIIKSGRQIVRPLRNKFDSVQRERETERVNTCECVLCSYCVLVLAERIVANGKGRRRSRRRRKEHKAD